MSTIHIAEPGGQPASYPEEQAHALWSQGRISPQAHYWKEGMPDWRPVGEYFGGAQNVGGPPPLSAARPNVAAARGFAKDPTTLTKFLKVLLWISLVLSGISVVLATFSIITGQAPLSEDNLTASGIAEILLALVSTLVYLATIVPFLMWIHRANRNARHFGAQDLKFTPGWAVGWYFIPILNLWKPFQSMKEIWQASKDPLNWSAQLVSPIVGNWWGLWVLTNILGQLSLRLSMKNIPASQLTVQLVDLGSDLAHIALCILAIKMITSIYQMQSEWAQRQA
jgi:Domain of unknown function (DUF4328)/GYF domain 2